MSITIFGTIWLIISFLGLILRSSKVVFSLLAFGMCLQSTNVLYIGETGIGPGVTACFFLVLFFILNFNSKNNFKIDNSYLGKKILVLFSLIILTVIFSFAFNNLWQSQNLFSFVQLALYFTVFLLCFYLKGINAAFLDKLIHRLTIFLLIIGVVQLAITSNFVPRFDFIKQLLFNDNAENVYFNSDNYFRVCSTFMEPSYYATLLIPIYSYYFLKYKKLSNLPLLLCIIIEIILTFSTTAYIAFFIANFLLIVSNVNKKITTIILVIGFVGCTVLLLFFGDILNEVIFNKLESGSANTRFWWDYACIEAFKMSPIFGAGYKAVRGSSLLTSVLGQLGLIGFVFLILIFAIFVYLFYKNKKNNFIISNLSFCLVALFICLFIACPDLDMCTLRLFLFLFASFSRYSSLLKKAKNKPNAKFNKKLLINR